MTARTHAEIVEALGGPRVVADALGIPSPNTVLYWTREGRSIPSKRWRQIVDLPSAKKAGITLEELAADRGAAPAESPQAEAA